MLTRWHSATASLVRFLFSKGGVTSILLAGGILFVISSLYNGKSPTSPARDDDAKLQASAAKCKEIADFVQREACEKPIEEALRRKEKLLAEDRLKKEREASEERLRAADAQKKEREYQAYKQEKIAHDNIKAHFEKISTERQQLSYENYRKSEDLVKDFYQQRTKLGLQVPQENRWQTNYDLREIDVLPFESGAAVILKYLGSVSQKEISNALSGLNQTILLGRPEQVRAFQQTGSRLPLFPFAPAVPAAPKFTAIDGKPPTSEQLAEQQRIHVKQKLGSIIRYIYTDCEDHYRSLYVQHLKNLFREYIQRFTKVVAEPVRDEAYPTFLLEPEATSNERLAASLQILFTERLTPVVRKKLEETPEALFTRGCPGDRAAIHEISVRSLPNFGKTRLPFPKDFENYGKADVPTLIRAMEVSYEACEEGSRWYYSDIYVQEIARKIAYLKNKRDPLPSDNALSARLNSEDRKIRYGAIIAILRSDAISKSIADQLPKAAGGLFFDRCPQTPPAEQIHFFRREMEAKKVAYEEMRKKFETPVKQ